MVLYNRWVSWRDQAVVEMSSEPDHAPTTPPAKCQQAGPSAIAHSQSASTAPTVNNVFVDSRWPLVSPVVEFPWCSRSRQVVTTMPPVVPPIGQSDSFCRKPLLMCGALRYTGTDWFSFGDRLNNNGHESADDTLAVRPDLAYQIPYEG